MSIIHLFSLNCKSFGPFHPPDSRLFIGIPATNSLCNTLAPGEHLWHVKRGRILSLLYMYIVTRPQQVALFGLTPPGNTRRQTPGTTAGIKYERATIPSPVAAKSTVDPLAVAPVISSLRFKNSHSTQSPSTPQGATW